MRPWGFWLLAWQGLEHGAGVFLSKKRVVVLYVEDWKFAEVCFLQ